MCVVLINTSTGDRVLKIWMVCKNGRKAHIGVLCLVVEVIVLMSGEECACVIGSPRTVPFECV
jgi:hypothetical protein